MLINGSWLPERPSTEGLVDSFIRTGDFENAQKLTGLNSEKRSERHHLLLKRAALPLYELALNGLSERLIKEAMDVYGEAATLLRDELDYFVDTPESADREQSRGRLTELAVFCLQARDLQWQEPTLVLLPTSREDDRNFCHAIDFRLLGMKGDQTYTYPIQLKTLLKKEDIDFYDSSIYLLGLNQLDNNYGRPQHYNSLVNTLLREINGKASKSDAMFLDKATLKFYEIIADKYREQQLAA